jgi:peptidylprolyl isomerase/peptidyl-prolyl cis-trans isomerase B (cyclophilin B)
MAFMLSESARNTLGLGATAALVSFADDDVLKAYPEKILADITICNVLGLMNGDENNRFNPSNSGTRAEAVTVINRFGDIIQKELDAYTAMMEELNKQIEESLVTYDQIPTGHPTATIMMSNNKKIVVELYPEYAPQTVANFVKLAKDGFYNGLTFHRIVEGFVAQGGDPSGDGTGGSGTYIKGEFLDNGFKQNTLKHTRGVISMARSNHPDSASSQFFICYGDASMLDGQYAAFGKVKTGMDVVDGFAKVEMTENSSGEFASPKEPIVIKSITIK